jgi:hypothetical protein
MGYPAEMEKELKKQKRTKRNDRKIKDLIFG